MRKFVIGALLAGWVLAVPGVMAQNPDGSVTITPFKLYGMIEGEQRKSKIQTRILKSHAERLAALEKRVAELEGNLNVAARTSR